MKNCRIGDCVKEYVLLLYLPAQLLSGGKGCGSCSWGANYGSKGFSDWLPECCMVPLTSRRNALLGVSGKEV